MSKGKVNKEGVRKGYQWPASALTSNEMQILAEMREKTGMPITVLLKRAVMELGAKRSHLLED